MDKNSAFGQLFEQGKAAVDDSASNIVDTTKKQITGSQNSNNQNQQSNTQNTEVQSQLSNESREIVEDFYAPSTATNKTQDSQQAGEGAQEKLAKVRKELAELKSELHQETYVKPLFSYEEKYKQSNAQAQQAQQQEAIEEQKKMEELQLQEKKNDDIAKFRAQRGIEMRASAG